MGIFKAHTKHSDSLANTQISELEEKLNTRRALQNITNRINAAQNLKNILVDLREDVLSLFDAKSITIYVKDQSTNEIYSMFLAGSKLSEIRLPITNQSIAGYAANNIKAVNIVDAYDSEELKNIGPELSFDSSWDKKSGIKTTQVMAVPILYEENVMGVIQILNKENGEKFSDDDEAFLKEIADVLGIAFFNHERIKKKKKSRFDYLIRYGLISAEDLEDAYGKSHDNRETIEDYLMKTFKISKEDIGKSLAEFYGCEFVQFSDKTPTPFDLLKSLKEEYLRREMWVPLERKAGKVRIIIDDPNNVLKRDMIESLLKTRAVVYDIALYGDIKKYINFFYQTDEVSGSISDIIGQLDAEDETDEDEGVTESDSIIMQLVNRVINDAYNRNASDIHVEPNLSKNNVEVRYRIDGDLMKYQTFPFSYKSAVVSRIKIMSNLDITERRIPQDGKIKFRRPRGDDVELRVATVPTQGGVEDVVMRILARGETLPLEDMSLSTSNYNNLVDIIKKPYGMILCVGPTGSGKTTTLHACLKYINKPETKIWTAEDPVEITQYGLRQVQVNPKIGFDFAAAMRAFLRADPDVIMVGEMRDYETAKTGVEASLTGHLVFTTLHTNSAPETIIRLLEMGIDPLNFADSLLGILAQRLVRTLCKNCKEQYHPTREEYDELVVNYGEELFEKLNFPYDDNFKLSRPVGCRKCENTGYRGRMGLHELLVSSDRIKDLVTKKATIEAIRNVSIEEGMRTLLQDGIEKIVRGFTDFNQVRKVCTK